MNSLNHVAAGVGMNMPPQGTILPGTTIQLGKYTVLIDRYIAEGGFAHVYVATIVGMNFPVVVKRIAVADKERLAIVNSEIETMKQLGKHKNIVEYMDSCMGKLEGGGYEVLILMEYCGGGPVIDLMNRRLQNRLTEPEILKIFSNVCEAVAYMHYSDPPILHRDIKVENILLSNNDYKLCDFGSATTNILRGDNIPRNVKDIQLLEEEINNHTTLQYRAPEMIDLYMRKGIDEKIDIWALGVLLYKLCYYTTPFEEQGQLAILNVRYTIPDHPIFSPALINLFKCMLKEDPRQRPNIYKVMQMTSALRGLACPIHNIYPETSFSPAAPEPQVSSTANILSNAAMRRPMNVLPSIEPMRRGRPTRSPAAHTPAMHQEASSSTFATASSSGFDDSFGQFGQAVDPASQFSQLPPSGDAFDFGSTVNKGVQPNGKRFTLDFESTKGKDEFGFGFSYDFSSSGSKSVAPTAVAATRPRPPSFSEPDLLLPETSQISTKSVVKNAMPSQLSGNNSGYSKTKQNADDLFFGSSSGIKFDKAENDSRPGTPSSFGSTPQATMGLNSPASHVGSQSSGMSKPLLSNRQSPAISSPVARGTAGFQGHQGANSLLNKDVRSNGTGNSRYGSPVPGASSATRIESSVKNHKPSANQGAVNNSSSTAKSDLLSAKMESFALLQRQQMEQLGKFTVDSAAPALSAQNTQGKAKVLDPSRTLDGLRSMDVNSRPATASPTISSGYSNNTSAPVQSSSVSRLASYPPGPSAELPALDRNQLAQRDMDAEMKLIQLQQKEFEKQQQELLVLQRTQLEEQQRQHRLQQEQLQKAQQQQIQLQHEKWQERKRMMKEQEQLAQKQLSQQKDLVQQHQSQQQFQQQQQELQQQRQQVPASVSSLTSSLASASLRSGSPQPNTYRRSLSGNSSQSAASSPSASMSSINSNNAAASPLDTNTTPSVPVKSARRAGVYGAGQVAGTTASNVKSRRTSFTAPPPGQKPELLPKPTRFRMKDGTGTLMAGEEEAFRRKFPSTGLEDDVVVPFDLGGSPVQASQTVVAPYESASSFVYRSSESQYRREEEDEEEEEEVLVRNRPRPSATSASQVQQPAARTTLSSGGSNGQPLRSVYQAEKNGVEEEDQSSEPMESVRERVQRMNRVGRVV